MPSTVTNYRLGLPWLFGVAFAVMAMPPAAAETPSPALRERFLAEAPKAWRQYREAVRRLPCSYTGQARHTAGTEEEFVVEFRSNENCKLMTSKQTKTEAGKDSYVESAYVVNSRYAFELKKRSPHTQWVLTSAVLLSNEAEAEKILYTLKVNECTLSRLVHVDLFFLGNLVQRPYFRVVTCEYVNDSGSELVKVTFANEHDVDDDPIQGGYLLLDPKHYWCLRGYEVSVKTKGGASTWSFTTLDFKSHQDIPASYGYTFEKLISFKGESYKFSGGGAVKFQFPEQPLPESDFTLAAFGLPETFELQQQAKSKPNYWLWTALVGGACILIGTAARWWVRRRWVA